MVNFTLKMICRTFAVIPLFLILSIPLPKSNAQENNPTFYFGVDLSYVNEMEDCGAIYRENGVPQDVFQLMAEHGANLVRARLWYAPDWTTYSTFADVKQTLQRAHEQERATLLAIHYSDTWADAGRQEIPAEWQKFTTTAELADAVYDYTYQVLQELYADNLLPDFVQIGNEVNSGLLKHEMVIDWGRDSQLLKAGIQAVRDFSTQTDTRPQIVLHIAQPEHTTWWFSEAQKAGITDFDVIGISYYPQWSRFSISEVGEQVRYLREHFGKAVMIVETAYPWTLEAIDESATNILSEGLADYPISPTGQKQFMIDLTQILINNGASGVIYWEPAWVSTDCATQWGQGSHWENATFFDFYNDNEVHTGIEYLSHEYHYPTEDE